ncbi:L-lysine 2,3-aminomutase [Candidatus Ecksteinia adelgidicola]|nr:L-lysine 2,3-aminomutase [Candidatus Ecksteinia adelgidicola]
MAYIKLKNTVYKKDWLYQLSNVITDPNELLQILLLNTNSEFLKGRNARKLFPMRVPHSFVERMRPGDADDPLFRQVITSQEEFINASDFILDPLSEHCNIVVPGLLHKYYNRVLLLVKGGCAVNCRYCFRRHFPYHNHQGNKSNWKQALDYIHKKSSINEIIFSGGDPLMAKDDELGWLITQLSHIPHIKRLRIHTRLLVMIPARITKKLCYWLSKSHLQVIIVTHINHANEINDELKIAIEKLRLKKITLLNQSVLIHRVNDNADTLATLSNALFDIGILPYYIHLLDKVQGTSHFVVNDQQARIIMKSLLGKISGYLVPRLMREIAGKSSKIPLDLYL